MAKKKTATKKTAPKKAAAKKSATKKKTAPKKIAASKKAAVKNGAPTKSAKVKKTTAAKKSSKNSGSQDEEKNESTLRKMTTREKHTPAVFKLPSKKNTPIVFTLEDVREVLRSRRKDKPESETPQKTSSRKSARKKSAPADTKPEPQAETPVERRSYGAASLSDILGFNPAQKKEKAFALDEERVPQKWMKYYRLLVELRAHVKEELDEHTKETLKRSAKDDSGDISSFSSHMADNGTDAFDRDFALSLVSNEQEALAEIEGAIQRIYNGTYGVCEITGQKIAQERLNAVPFTRFSREGQEDFERTRRRRAQRGGGFLDASPDDSISFAEDDDS